MDFSELFKQTGRLCHFSPDGDYLANAVEYRLIVRDVKTLQILHLFTCLDAIQEIEWSSDSQFILCGMYKRGLVQVFSLEKPDWKCKIDEGSVGLVSVRWSADGRHILSTAEFNLRITIWSLTNVSVSYIKYPKSCSKGMDFCKGGKYLALAERRDCRDHISIFDYKSWHLVKHFETETEDLDGVEWSPDGRVLAVWEACLWYKLLLYSVDGRCLATYSAYSDALGIKSVAFSPSSQFLAIGSYDQKIRVLNHVTWKPVVDHTHPAVMDCNPNMVVYREVVSRSQLIGETEPPPGVVYGTKSKYEVQEGSVQVPVVRPDPKKANPRIGVSLLNFCQNTRYLISRNDNMPTALWIWSVERLSHVALLLQDAPVKCAVWHPTSSRLALCCGTNKVYMWSPSGCLVVEVPTEASFTVQSLKWHPDGSALLLIGRDHMCVCFLSSPDTTPTHDVSH